MKKNDLVVMLEDIYRDIQEYIVPYDSDVLNVFKYYINENNITDIDETSIFFEEPITEEEDV
jgi:hypothetical protein